MSALVLVGVLSPPPPAVAQAPMDQSAYVATGELPEVKLTATPGTIASGDTTTLSWTTTNDASTCVAGGDWNGGKTTFGSDSSPILTDVKSYTFTLTCKNDAGSGKASVSVTVTDDAAAASAAAASGASSSSSSASSGSTSQKRYCQGRLPCLGKSDVSGHNHSGDCWGWNGDRVMNISAFDAQFHKAASGISSIEISGICGTDLGPALSGMLSAGGQVHDHTAADKSNANANMIPYFVGYFDASKP